MPPDLAFGAGLTLAADDGCLRFYHRALGGAVYRAIRASLVAGEEGGP